MNGTVGGLFCRSDTIAQFAVEVFKIWIAENNVFEFSARRMLLTTTMVAAVYVTLNTGS